MSGLSPRRRDNRHPRNVVIIVTEGITEEIYFNGLKQRNSNIEMKPRKGKRTNARQLMEECERQIYANEIDIERGDIAICAFDVDNNSQDDIKVAIEIAEKNKIIVAVSNPCFELWYLLHFRDINHRVTSIEVQKELLGYIEKFEKTKDYRDLLITKKEKAIARAEKIVRKRSIRTTFDYAHNKNNPCTSVHCAINAIERLARENQRRQ